MQQVLISHAVLMENTADYQFKYYVSGRRRGVAKQIWKSHDDIYTYIQDIFVCKYEIISEIIIVL